MNYWLVKSEPVKYSWENFYNEQRTFWDGIRNYAARNNMQAMAKGDKAFFYHSNEGKEIVGIATVVKTAYQDPTTPEPAWVVVDLKADKKLKNPVTLQQIKAEKSLKDMVLINNSRLSVQPVSPEEWFKIIEMSGE